MAVHTAPVQAAVQQLLMEHGEYAALELLLVANRLGYDHYRAWREGRLDTLDAEFADGKRETCEWPGLAGVLATCPAYDQPSRAFNLVIALLSHWGLDERGIEPRRSLQGILPGLLERFLSKQAQATAARPFIG